MSLTDPKIDASGANERTHTASVGRQQGILEVRRVLDACALG